MLDAIAAALPMALLVLPVLGILYMVLRLANAVAQVARLVLAVRGVRLRAAPSRTA